MRPIGIILLIALLAALVYSQRHMFIKGLADEVKKELESVPPDSSGRGKVSADSGETEDPGPSFLALRREGERLFEAGDLPGSEAAFRKALSKNPDDPRPYAHLGVICSARGNLKDALQFWEQAVERAPDNEGYLVNLGKAYAQLGRREEAIARWRKVLSMNPYNTTVRELIQKETRGAEGNRTVQ